jgi:pyruvate dehydrogenase E2 component (dihydrolipoamide acetyltransferase)
MTVQHFRLPDLGEGLTDAEVVRWLVAEGDVIEVDQPVAEVMTAKASVELPSPFGGVVVRLHYGVGDVVEVGSPLVSIGEAADVVAGDSSAAGASADETAADAPVAGADGDRPAAAAASGVEADQSGDGASGSGNVLVGYGTRPARRRRRRAATMAASDEGTRDPEAPLAPETGRGGPAVLSPVVRRLARDLGVDLAAVEGSGPQGVISRGDVELAAGESDIERSIESGAAPHAGARAASEVERIPMRGLQRQMAERLARSRREIPEATVWVDADASGLLEAKRTIDGTHPDHETGVGLTSWVARFCVLGLQQWPLLNSRIEGEEIVVSRRVNLGFAAQTDHGLVVPVVHDAEQLDLFELDSEIRRLTRAARDGKLTRGDVTGGSFTLNNYGVFGVDGSAAIINFPEVAIVGVGRIIQRPWVVDGEVRPRPVTELTLAFDHRVCDGGVAGGFLRFVADCVQQPVRLLRL